MWPPELLLPVLSHFFCSFALQLCCTLAGPSGMPGSPLLQSLCTAAQDSQLALFPGQTPLPASGIRLHCRWASADGRVGRRPSPGLRAPHPCLGSTALTLFTLVLCVFHFQSFTLNEAVGERECISSFCPFLDSIWVRTGVRNVCHTEPRKGSPGRKRGLGGRAGWALPSLRYRQDEGPHPPQMHTETPDSWQGLAATDEDGTVAAPRCASPTSLRGGAHRNLTLSVKCPGMKTLKCD